MELNEKPLVSVITIFLNAERFLEEAILSVLAQTHGRWELLLVDDGSSDGSVSVAKRWEQQLPDRIRYLQHPDGENRGMSASRNLGIAHARGELIGFLDADDVWLPEKLERQVELMRAQPEAAMICGPTECWYGWTGRAEDLARDTVRSIGIPLRTLVKPPCLLAELPLDKVKTPATCSVLIRRKLLKEVGGFEENFRGMFEDQAFFAKVYLRAAVYATDECLDKYRQHPHSCCALAREAQQYDPQGPNATHLQFLRWLEAFLRDQSVTEREIWQAVSHALWPYRHPVLHRLAQWYVGARRRVRVAKTLARNRRPVAALQTILAPISRSRAAGRARQ